MRLPRLITIPGFRDARGTLSVIEWEECLPFIPRRFYYIYDVPKGATRGVHSHGSEEEVILALKGNFTVLVDDGRTRAEHRLEHPGVALYIPPLIWHELFDFSAGAICAVFASQRSNPGDYCRDYEEFLRSHTGPK